ncbi:hypothetical protein D3C81_1497060 [compost metagenome]
MLAICCELSVICCMVSTTRPTTSRPSPAVLDASLASALACRALSAFCFTVAVNCSMLAAVSWSDAACCSVRDDKSRLPAAICPVAVPMASVRSSTEPTVRISACCMPCRLLIIMPISSLARVSMLRCRSPPAMCSNSTMAA